MIYIRIAADGENLTDRLPQSSIIKVSEKKTAKAKKEAALGELVKCSLFAAADVKDVNVAYGKHGKPYLLGRRDIAYNISHSENIAVGVLMTEAFGCEVGCDVEMIDRGADGERQKRISKRFFTDNEQNAVSEALDPTSEFYRIWSLKESYIKYTGEGLSRPLSSFDVTLGVDGVYMTSETICDREGNEYAFSVCVPSHKRDIPIDKITIE